MTMRAPRHVKADSACGTAPRNSAVSVVGVEPGSQRQRQRGIRVRVLEQHAALESTPCCRESLLAAARRAPRCSSAANGAARLLERGGVQRHLGRLLPHRRCASARPMPYADSTPASGWMNTLLHAERVGDQAGVLARGAAEAGERVLGDVVAALHGDLLDGVRHVLDRDADAAGGERGGVVLRAGAADSAASAANCSAHDVRIERLIAARGRTTTGRSPAGCGPAAHCNR